MAAVRPKSLSFISVDRLLVAFDLHDAHHGAEDSSRMIRMRYVSTSTRIWGIR
jgi:hypothetical protein